MKKHGLLCDMLSAEIPPHPCHFFSLQTFFSNHASASTSARAIGGLSLPRSLSLSSPPDPSRRHIHSRFSWSGRNLGTRRRLSVSWRHGREVEAGKAWRRGLRGGLICTLQILTLSSTVLTLRGGGRSLNSKLRTLSAAAAQLQCRRRRLRGTAALEGEKAATAFLSTPHSHQGSVCSPHRPASLFCWENLRWYFYSVPSRAFFSFFTRPPLGSIRGGILSVCDPLRLLCASAAAALLPSSLSQFEKLCP